MLLKNTTITAIGSALEYYDFLVYVMLSHILLQVFFPESLNANQALQTLCVFVTMYIARPIGGICFGSIGDRFGRKKSFMISIYLMGLSTLGIGLLPSYADIGLLAPLLLILFRIIQGFAQGGQIPSAMTLIVEQAPAKRQCTNLSILFAFLGCGSILSALVCYSITQLMNKNYLIEYGWRLPFILGGLLAIIGFIFREKLTESPLMKSKAFTPSHQPLVTLFKEYKTEMAVGIGISLASASLVVFCLYLPSYLHQYYDVAKEQSYLVLLIGFIFCAAILPIMGLLADRIGASKLLTYGLSIICIGAYPLTYLLGLGNYYYLVLFIILYQGCIAVTTACYPMILTKLFPTHIRLSGIAISYTVTFLLAAFIPSIAVELIELGQNPNIIYLLFMILSLISLTALSYYKKVLQQDKLINQRLELSLR